MAHEVIIQGIVAGRETMGTVEGKPQRYRRLAAIGYRDDEPEPLVFPIDGRTASRMGLSIFSIDQLRHINPDLIPYIRKALREAPRQKVRR